MLRHRPWFLIVALLLAIGLPVVALAGGWSTVTLDSQPGGLTAGSETTIGFTVLQHGKTPVVGEEPKIILTDPTTGQSKIVIAQPEGKPGHYTATFALDKPGTWTWVIDVFEGPHQMQALNVAAAPAPAPEPPVGQSTTADWPVVAAGVALALLVGVAFASGLRRRGQPGPVAR